MISVVVVSLNEAKKLEECFKSVQGLADEIIVMDLGSTDQTIEVAKKYQAKIFHHSRVDYVELVRNESINLAGGDWILVLDPDERVTSALAKKLKEVAQQDKYVALSISRKNIFFGSWISHTNFWPDRHIRFFKKGAVEWVDRIHAHYSKDGGLIKVNGPILELPAKEELALEHYGYDSYGQFLDRQRRYAKVEAANRFKEGVRVNLKEWVWRSLREFLVRFIKHQGYLDGINGLFLVFGLMYYQCLVNKELATMKQ